jgi:hypothetical protein
MRRSRAAIAFPAALEQSQQLVVVVVDGAVHVLAGEQRELLNVPRPHPFRADPVQECGIESLLDDEALELGLQHRHVA